MMATKERDAVSGTVSVDADSTPVKEAAEEDTMRSLLTSVLSQLNRIQSLEETTRYLQSEWLSSENDLKVAMQDEATWNALKLPTRLKLAIKSEISRKENAAAAAALQRKKKEEELSSSVPAPIDLESLTKTVKQDQLCDESYLNMAMQEFDEEDVVEKERGDEKGFVTGDGLTASSTRPSLRLDIEHKASEDEEGADGAVNTVGEGAQEEHGDYEEKGLLATLGDDDDDGFRDQVNQKWVKSYSPEHRSAYYFNEVTEETSWSLPEGVEASREDEWAVNSWEAEATQEGGEKRDSEMQPNSNFGEYVANEVETETTMTEDPASEGLPLPSGPAPTAYTRPVAPPSAPALPAELVEAFQVEPLSVEATPINSPDQRGASYPVLVDEAEALTLSSSDVESEDEEEYEDEDEDRAYRGGADAGVDDAEEDDEDDDYSSGDDDDVMVDPQNLQMLMDMGFSEEIAARALQKAHNDVQMATIACLRQEEEGNQPSPVTRVIDRNRNRDRDRDREQRNSAPDRPVFSAETGTEGMRRLSEDADDGARVRGSPQRRSIMSRISRSLNRTISGAKKAKARREDMGINFDDS